MGPLSNLDSSVADRQEDQRPGQRRRLSSFEATYWWPGSDWEGQHSPGRGGWLGQPIRRPGWGKLHGNFHVLWCTGYLQKWSKSFVSLSILIIWYWNQFDHTIFTVNICWQKLELPTTNTLLLADHGNAVAALTPPVLSHSRLIPSVFILWNIAI